MVEHGAMNQVVLLRGGSVEVQPIPELPPIACGSTSSVCSSAYWPARAAWGTVSVYTIQLEPGANSTNSFVQVR